MASGDGLGLFFTLNRVPCGPPAPPTPPAPPPGLPSSIITGTEDQNVPPFTRPAHVTGCVVGDILVAFMSMFDTTGLSMVGSLLADGASCERNRTQAPARFTARCLPELR